MGCINNHCFLDEMNHRGENGFTGNKSSESSSPIISPIKYVPDIYF